MQYSAVTQSMYTMADNNDRVRELGLASSFSPVGRIVVVVVVMDDALRSARGATEDGW